MSEKPQSDPYVLLEQQVVEFVREEMSWLPANSIGDSPIEKILFTALEAMVRFGCCEYRLIETPTSYRPLNAILQQCNPFALVVDPQAQLEGWRVDFLVYAWDFGRVTGKPQWRRLIVECDGHDFHERTKQQAARDRSRDRAFQIRGYGVLRFTGSELHRDPLGCAKQVSSWGTMGW